MKERLFTIYAIRNKVNGKIYIGRTEQSVRERVLLHLYALKKCRHNSKTLQYDYKKYGKEAFEFYEIEDNVSFDNRDRKSFYMDLYRSCNEKYGYNCQDQHSKAKEDFEIIHGRPEIPE